MAIILLVNGNHSKFSLVILILTHILTQKSLKITSTGTFLGTPSTAITMTAAVSPSISLHVTAIAEHVYVRGKN